MKNDNREKVELGGECVGNGREKDREGKEARQAIESTRECGKWERGRDDEEAREKVESARGCGKYERGREPEEARQNRQGNRRQGGEEEVVIWLGRGAARVEGSKAQGRYRKQGRKEGQRIQQDREQWRGRG